MRRGIEGATAQMAHRAEVGLDGAALALHRGLPDLQVGEAFASTVSLSA
jgi:hypothetical protein